LISLFLFGIILILIFIILEGWRGGQGGEKKLLWLIVEEKCVCVCVCVGTRKKEEGRRGV